MATARAEAVALRVAVDHVAAGRTASAKAEAMIVAAHRELMAALIAVAATIPSEEIRGAFADQVDDVDRAILRGLDQGLSRNALHTRLGISRRDIDERIPRLHRLAGTITPFQLGRAATALGWLEPASS